MRAGAISHAPLHTAHQAGHIVGVGQELRVNQRRRQWVRAGQAQLAPAFRLQHTDMAAEAMAPGVAPAMVGLLAGQKVQLQVHLRLRRPAADKAARFRQIAGQRARAVLAPFPCALRNALQAGQRYAKALRRAWQAVHHGHIRVVVQVRAHAGQVCLYRHAHLLQMLARPKTREHQQLRRL